MILDIPIDCFPLCEYQIVVEEKDFHVREFHARLSAKGTRADEFPIGVQQLQIFLGEEGIVSDHQPIMDDPQSQGVVRDTRLRVDSLEQTPNGCNRFLDITMIGVIRTRAMQNRFQQDRISTESGGRSIQERGERQSTTFQS